MGGLPQPIPAHQGPRLLFCHLPTGLLAPRWRWCPGHGPEGGNEKGRGGLFIFRTKGRKNLRGPSAPPPRPLPPQDIVAQPCLRTDWDSEWRPRVQRQLTTKKSLPPLRLSDMAKAVEASPWRHFLPYFSGKGRRPFRIPEEQVNENQALPESRPSGEQRVEGPEASASCLSRWRMGWAMKEARLLLRRQAAAGGGLTAPGLPCRPVTAL